MAFQLVERLKPCFWNGLVFPAVFFERVGEVAQLCVFCAVVDSGEDEVELALKMIPDEVGLSHAPAAIQNHKFRLA